jgi:hypothetical protein
MSVILFVSVSAKFGIFTIVGLNGTLLVEDKIRTLECPNQVRVFVSTIVPFRPTTVKTPNLEQIETKQITVCRMVRRRI